MTPEEKERYMACNSRRIASREYYKKYPEEWYLLYDY
jgi:hypothetical protein